MNKKKSILTVLLASILILASLPLVYPATDTGSSPSVVTAGYATINKYISLTITTELGALFWPDYNPGVNNVSTNETMNISVDYGTNVETNIYFNATDMDCDGGGCTPVTDVILRGNLSLHNATTNQSSYGEQAAGWYQFGTFEVNGYGPNYTFNNTFGYFGNISKPGASGNKDEVWFFLNIPTGHTAGDYRTNLTVKATEKGVNP